MAHFLLFGSCRGPWLFVTWAACNFCQSSGESQCRRELGAIHGTTGLWPSWPVRRIVLLCLSAVCQTVCFPVSVGISHSLTGRGHSQGATSVAKYCGVPETATWCCTLLASSWIQQFGCTRCHVLAMSRHKSLPPKFSVTQLSTDQNVGS